ncbi:MAG: TauD/TfdA dioxygenase family protein [Zwartia sp.]
MSSTIDSYVPVSVQPLASALGAEIRGIDFSRPLTDAVRKQIEEAWTKHLVLRFRGMPTLSADDLIAFSKNFGKLDARPIGSSDKNPYFEVDKPEITIISNVVVAGKPIGGLGAYEAVWHSDMTYVDLPPKASCLYAIEIPPTGGNTYFVNMYEAYDTLPIQLKNRIASLSCVHDASRNSAGELRKGFAEINDPIKTVGAVHPLVRVHPASNKRCLFLGRRRGAYVSGLSLVDSEALLDELWAHATEPRFMWSQEWQLGDLVMWDNRCAMHRREAFDPSTRRLMLRTQISGEAVLPG